MPIYEFYCARCNMIFIFLSRTVNPRKVPRCPRCGNPRMRRMISRFSSIRARGEGEEGGPDELPVDETRLERAVSALEKEASAVDEEDPRQAARLMRRFADATGLKFSPTMEEAMRRMEAGEDPEAIEEEMGELLESEEEPFVFPGEQGSRAPGGRRAPPARDEKLYDL